MNNDHIVWSGLSRHYCSFRADNAAPVTSFCRNPYNTTGLCNRVSCPLANSVYGTVLEINGERYLHLKTAERVHTPNRQWERIKLPASTTQAYEVIEKHMLNVYPDHQVHRCKLRLTRLDETLSRMRHLEKQSDKRDLVLPVKKKTERREAIREKKAEIAAKIENCVEEELLNRLQQGTYGALYEKNTQNKITDTQKKSEKQIEKEREIDDKTAAKKGKLTFETVEENETSTSDEDSVDEEDSRFLTELAKITSRPAKRRAHRVIEYEREREVDF